MEKPISPLRRLSAQSSASSTTWVPAMAWTLKLPLALVACLRMICLPGGALEMLAHFAREDAAYDCRWWSAKPAAVRPLLVSVAVLMSLRGVELGAQAAHLAEQLQHVERLRRAELAIERSDVDHDAFGVAPAGKAVELDVACGGRNRHAGIEALAGLRLDIDQVILHRLHPTL